jgi:hypothetical protein
MRGIFTGSTLEAITPVSNERMAGVKLSGRWPSRGFLAGGSGDIPMSAFAEQLENIRQARGWGSGEDDGFRESLHNMPPVHVRITRAGMSITWPEEIQGLLSNMFFRARDFESKAYGMDWPGVTPQTSRRKNPVDFMYLDNKQIAGIKRIVSEFVGKSFKGALAQTHYWDKWPAEEREVDPFERAKDVARLEEMKKLEAAFIRKRAKMPVYPGLPTTQEKRGDVSSRWRITAMAPQHPTELIRGVKRPRANGFTPARVAKAIARMEEARKIPNPILEERLRRHRRRDWLKWWGPI